MWGWKKNHLLIFFCKVRFFGFFIYFSVRYVITFPVGDASRGSLALHGAKGFLGVMKTGSLIKYPPAVLQLKYLYCFLQRSCTKSAHVIMIRAYCYIPGVLQYVNRGSIGESFAYLMPF